MNTFPPFVLFTAQRPGNSAAINEDLMNVMGRQIEARGFNYKIVTEVDAQLGEVPYFLVQLTTDKQREAVVYLYQLARHYSQPAVLYVDSNRFSTFIYLADGRGGVDVAREETAGKFESLTELEATLRNEYFVDQYGFKYAVNPGAQS